MRTGQGTSRWGGWLATIALAAAMFAAVACQMVFDGELGVVQCTVEGVYGPPACPAGLSCVSGTCVSVGAPLGGLCAQDSDCRSPAFCFIPAALGQEGEPYCSRGCCRSEDCGEATAGQVCWPPAAGGSALCGPALALGRWALGSAAAGQGCSEHAQCRSGRCQDGYCVDSCCGDGDCLEEGQACRLSNFGDASEVRWVCGVAELGAIYGPLSCEPADENCASGACIALSPPVCAQPCCSSPECGSYTNADGELAFRACALFEDGAISCSKELPATATLPVGKACLDDEECRSGYCLPGEGYCSDVCCTDQDCGDLERFVCRPQGEVGDMSAPEASWILRCVRK